MSMARSILLFWDFGKYEVLAIMYIIKILRFSHLPSYIGDSEIVESCFLGHLCNQRKPEELHTWQNHLNGVHFHNTSIHYTLYPIALQPSIF